MSIAGSPDIGVVFMEQPPSAEAAVRRAGSYAAVIAGSSWNAEMLRAAGISNVKVARQGIDPQLFFPGPGDGAFGDRFVVFSGGKLEYRKGQDIVLAAFRAFHARRPDALLAVSWQNFSTDPHAPAMLRAGHIDRAPEAAEGGGLDVQKWLADNGVAPDSFVDVGLMPNHLVGDVMRQADVAVFPNRCEGGTNLVAMECMASGAPVILSANTGHLDLIHPDRCLSLEAQGPVAVASMLGPAEGWGESDVGEVVAALESVYSDRNAAKRRAAEAVDFMRDWTWVKQVGRMLDVVAEVI
jgi:glycosyltransferase involved in cell wall biosynthesis